MIRRYAARFESQQLVSELHLLQISLAKLNMTSKSYAESSKVSPENCPNFSPIVLKFALPLKKDAFKNYKTIDQTFLQAASAVMAAIPAEIHKNITIFRSIIDRKSKNNLHAITVILPYYYKSQASKLLLEGIQMGDKRVPLYSIVEPEGAEYPKLVTISFRNLPNFLPPQEVFQYSELQNFNPLPNIQHQKRLLPNGEGFFFTGMAKADLIVKDEDTEQRLRAWAMESYQLFRNCRNATFQACAFSMLECSNCKAANLQFRHHPSRCNIIFDNQRKENECETNIAEKDNADYVMETSGNGKHGIMENDQETTLSNETSPTTNAEEMQSSSENESDLESENEPAEKAQKAEIETTNDEVQEKSSNANPEQNVVPSTAVVLVYDAKALCSKILSIQSVIRDNPQIGKKFEETNPKNFSIGDLTYNLDFERIKTNHMRNLFKTHACRNKNSQEIYNTHEEVEKIIGRYDIFYNQKNGRLYCTNLYNDVKLRLQLFERSKPPPMANLK